MVARAAVMHIAERALKRVRTRTVGRHKEQLHPRVAGQPLLHGFRLMDLIVIHDHIEPGVPLGGIAGLQDREQVSEQRVGFARSQAVEQRTGGQIECPGVMMAS